MAGKVVPKLQRTMLAPRLRAVGFAWLPLLLQLHTLGR